MRPWALGGEMAPLIKMAKIEPIPSHFFSVTAYLHRYAPIYVFGFPGNNCMCFTLLLLCATAHHHIIIIMCTLYKLSCTVSIIAYTYEGSYLCDVALQPLLT